jgi:hypothetical protein
MLYEQIFMIAGEDETCLVFAGTDREVYLLPVALPPAEYSHPQGFVCFILLLFLLRVWI